MEKIIGFIGGGNMGYAIGGGIISSNIVPKENIIYSDPSNERLKKLYNDLGVKTSNSNLLVANESDILFLAVKPDMYPEVINEIKDYIKKDVIIITIAAGVKLEKSRELFGKDVKIIRIMPNTPALVKESMTAVMPNEFITKEELDEALLLLNAFGKTEVVSEKLIDGVIAVSGSSPAYIFMLIEAMGDAAVSSGMPRKMAYKFAAQAVLGSAKMVLETGMHPGELKDMVCSPKGTTIEAVEKLEECGFRNAIIQGMKACEKKSKEMSK
ncbi:pyrroline-5-carboxylate reductase [Fusobacterium perfoetens]|uniref:pyrroline-5-carboxylate reductase n=1 Tax=Fusobacterium perfoetens TaxID=852 RepID=UPI000485812B|nr:pyrroline-5-carboxylate reductase [Fusobacterium perfoetens]